MAGKANPSLVARRYATALLALAQEKNCADEIGNALDDLATCILHHPDLANAMKSPLVEQAQKQAIALKLLQKMQAPDIMNDFIRVLARNNRLSMIVLCAKDYQNQLRQIKGELKAEITLAKMPDAALKKRFETAMQKISDGAVEIDFSLNKALIGGFMVQVGSRMMDASLRTHLLRVRQHMKEAKV